MSEKFVIEKEGKIMAAEIDPECNIKYSKPTKEQIDKFEEDKKFNSEITSMVLDKVSIKISIDNAINFDLEFVDKPLKYIEAYVAHLSKSVAKAASIRILRSEYLMR